MNFEAIEVFREEPYDTRFLKFKRYPTDSPACRNAEANYILVLDKGRYDDSNDKKRLIDPHAPRHCLVRQASLPIDFPADWFGENEIKIQDVLMKAPDPLYHFEPFMYQVDPGATNGLTSFNGQLFIVSFEAKSARIQRPTLKTSKEKDILTLVREKFPQLRW